MRGAGVSAPVCSGSWENTLRSFLLMPRFTVVDAAVMSYFNEVRRKPLSYATARICDVDENLSGW